MNQSDKQSQRFAFIRASWHAEIVNRAYGGFIQEMARQGVPETAIDLFEVPGAFEIPLQAKLLAGTKRYAAIIASGLVVDGGIYRHDFVASAVIDALMSVQLETMTPIISVVLTPHHFHEHAQHQQFFSDHFVVKGTEAAMACLQTVKSLARMHQLQS